MDSWASAASVRHGPMESHGASDLTVLTPADCSRKSGRPMQERGGIQCDTVCFFPAYTRQPNAHLQRFCCVRGPWRKLSMGEDCRDSCTAAVRRVPCPTISDTRMFSGPRHASAVRLLPGAPQGLRLGLLRTCSTSSTLPR